MNSSHRIASLDVLRGCAVLGIVWMNITAIAFPNAVYFNLPVSGSLSFTDILSWIIGTVMFDGKMRGLFSILFGASIILLIDKEEMAGRNGIRVQLVRMLWLFLIGLAHYMLLWSGDILMFYAVIAPIALLFTQSEPMELVKRAFQFFFFHFLLCLCAIVSLYYWSHAAVDVDASANLKAGFETFIGGISDPKNPSILKDFATYRGNFSAILNAHVADFPAQWLVTLLFSFFDTLGFMLLGMAMLKTGFLTGRWDGEQYRRTARHCFLIGVPPMIALCLWVVWTDFDPLASLGTVLVWAFPFRIPLTVGWAALIIWLFKRAPDSALVVRFSSVGRLALSNYLGTTLLLTALFYGWGLGLYGHIRPAYLPVFMISIWAIMLIWSPIWQNHLGTGPIERIWRRLSNLSGGN